MIKDNPNELKKLKRTMDESYNHGIFLPIVQEWNKLKSYSAETRTDEEKDYEYEALNILSNLLKNQEKNIELFFNNKEDKYKDAAIEYFGQPDSSDNFLEVLLNELKKEKDYERRTNIVSKLKNAENLSTIRTSLKKALLTAHNDKFSYFSELCSSVDNPGFINEIFLELNDRKNNVLLYWWKKILEIKIKDIIKLIKFFKKY